MRRSVDVGSGYFHPPTCGALSLSLLSLSLSLHDGILQSRWSRGRKSNKCVVCEVGSGDDDDGEKRVRLGRERERALRTLEDGSNLIQQLYTPAHGLHSLSLLFRSSQATSTCELRWRTKEGEPNVCYKLGPLLHVR